MKRGLAILVLMLLAACDRPVAASNGQQTLAQARAAFASNTNAGTVGGGPVDVPPPEIFRLVRYPTPLGNMDAYVTPPPADGGRRPAIIWMTGGDSNSINNVWSPEPVANDQSAHAFRDAGIVMMFPSLRGGNLNPGHREGFYGEVNDVLSAADYLAGLPYVDPKRIYLGGHSTGGALVLLTGEYSNRFRAVFSFGPAARASDYGDDFLPPGMKDPRELALRSPISWLASIRSPVFVFEGDQKPSNGAQIPRFQTANHNPLAHFYLVRGASHFSILAPTTALIARKILADTGATSNIDFSDGDFDSLTFPPPPPEQTDP